MKRLTGPVAMRVTKVPTTLKRIWRSVGALTTTELSGFRGRGLKKLIGMPLTWLAGGTLAASLLGFLGEPAAYFVAGTLCAATLLGIVWPAIAIRGVSGELRWQKSRAVEGESIETRLIVENRWAWPLIGAFVEADELSSLTLDDNQLRVGLAVIPARSRSEFTWQSSPQHRGLYPRSSVSIVVGFPFGVWFARRQLSIHRPLLIWPMTAALQDIPNLPGLQSSTVGSVRDRAGHEGDWFGTREYRSGDSLRSIHWAQSAKQDDLVICERQQVANHDVRVELTPPCSEGLSPKAEQEWEWSIRVAGSVCRTLVSHRWNVELVVPDARHNKSVRGSRIPDFLDTLARIECMSNLNAISDFKTSDRSHPAFTFRVGSYEALAQASQRLPSLASHEVCVGRGSLGRQQAMNRLRASTSFIDVEEPVWQQLTSIWRSLCHGSYSGYRRAVACRCQKGHRRAKRVAEESLRCDGEAELVYAKTLSQMVG